MRSISDPRDKGRIRSASEDNGRSLASSEAASCEFSVEEVGEEVGEQDPLLRNDGGVKNGGKNGSDEDEFRISQCEETLDEWIAEGYETTTGTNMVVSRVVVGGNDEVEEVEVVEVEVVEEEGAGIHLVQIVSKQDTKQPHEKEDYDEGRFSHFFSVFFFFQAFHYIG